MNGVKPLFTYPRADYHAFFFEDTHLLLVQWERDDKRELYLIAGQKDEVLELDFPGELYTEQVMDVTGNIFFISVQEESDVKRYILASYFVLNDIRYAVYYERGATQPGELVFFRVVDEGTSYGLEVIEDETEYASVAEEIEKRYTDFVYID